MKPPVEEFILKMIEHLGPLLGEHIENTLARFALGELNDYFLAKPAMVCMHAPDVCLLYTSPSPRDRG